MLENNQFNILCLLNRFSITAIFQCGFQKKANFFSDYLACIIRAEDKRQ